MNGFGSGMRAGWERVPTHISNTLSKLPGIKLITGMLGEPALVMARKSHLFALDWLGDDGEPLTVQKELMRHASIQTTLNTYGGGMMDSMREAHGRVVKQAMPR